MSDERCVCGAVEITDGLRRQKTPDDVTHRHDGPCYHTKAAVYTCDTEGHHWVWTRPIESSIDCWVGTCSICRKVKVETVDETMGAAGAPSGEGESVTGSEATARFRLGVAPSE